jgi:hypothetical protein
VGLGNLIQRGRQQKAAKPHVELERPERPRDLWLQPRIMEALTSVREVDVKPDMWLSPSVLAGWCPRAWTLAYRMGIPLVDEIGPDNRWWMDGGTAHHSLFQEWWMGPSKIIKGGWECPACGHTVGIDSSDMVPVYSHGEEIIHKVTTKSAVLCPDVCEKCGHKPSWRSPFSYVEPILYDLELRVVGWCDGIIDWSPHEDELWDLKTKASTESMEWIREAPDESNLKQLNWYLDMAKMAHGRLVYLDRASKHLVDAIVEHPVVADHELMAKEKEKVIAFREATKNPESSIPPCPDGGSTRFGPCQCRELESAWKNHRPRP